MFKLINKELSLYKAGLISFCLILFAYYPLISERIYFVDDITRSIKGYFGWIELGRPLTEWLAMFLTLNSSVLADVTPLPQLLSIFIFSFSILILIRNAFSKVTLGALLISATTVINPLVLGNMLYRFDSLSMAFSIMFSVLAWEKFNHAKLFQAFILLICSLCFYQPAIAIFPLLVISSFIKNSSTEEFKPSYVFKSLLMIVISCIFYFAFVVKLTIKKTESRGEINGLGETLIKNMVSGLNFISEIVWDSYGRIGFSILIGIFIIFICCYLKVLIVNILGKDKTNKYLKVLLLLFSPLAILLCAVGVNLILSNGYYPLRVLFPIAFIIFLMLTLASYSNALLKNISAISATCLLIVSFTTIYAMSSALYQQRQYDSYVLFSLGQYLSTSSENKNIYIFGYTDNSWSSGTTMKAFPIIRHAKNNFYDMTLSQALTNNGVKNVKFSSKGRVIASDLAKKACSNKMNKVYITPQYTVYSDNLTLLVYLGSKNCL